MLFHLYIDYVLELILCLRDVTNHVMSNFVQFRLRISKRNITISGEPPPGTHFTPNTNHSDPMAEPENSLFDIEVDADDYADAAAQDTPAVVDRTHQSEADFLAVKQIYKARQDGSRGSLYSELLEAVPLLAPPAGVDADAGVGADINADSAGAKVKLDKRSQLLLGYVVGELWYDGQFEEVWRLCRRVEEVCELDARFRPGVVRWRERAEGRIGSVSGSRDGAGERERV